MSTIDSMLLALFLGIEMILVVYGLAKLAWRNYSRGACYDLQSSCLLISFYCLIISIWRFFNLPALPSPFVVISLSPPISLILVIVWQYLSYNYLPARRREQREMWKGELKWVQGQIDTITLERVSQMVVLTKTATDPHLVNDDGRGERQKARSDELRDNAVLLSDMLERRKVLQKKLGLTLV